MTKQHPNDLEMDNLLAEAFALREVNSDALSPRMEEARRQHRVAHRQRQGRRLLLRRASILAGAASVVLLMATVLPRMLMWRALAQMADAAEGASTMHSVYWTLEKDGNRRKVMEVWVQGGRSRIERPTEVTIYADSKVYCYQPKAQVARWQHNPRGTNSSTASGFSLRAMMADMSSRGDNDKLTLSPDEQMVDNRPARVAIYEESGGNMRTIIYADPQTWLPFRVDHLRPTRDGWEISQTAEVEYNRAIPASLLAPKFPAGTRVAEVGAGREEWLRSLNKTVAVAHFGKDRITIRDVQMNEAGDIFMQYTGPRVDWYSADDDSLLSVRRSFTANFGVDSVAGEPLHMAVLTRMKPLTPAQSRLPQRVSIGAEHTSIHYRSLSKDVRVNKPIIDRTRGEPVNLTIPPASLTLLPDYMEYSAEKIREYAFKNAVDEARAKRWQEIATDNPEGLEKALELTRGIIKRSEQYMRESGNQVLQPEKWLEVAKLYHALGRREEALEAVARAEEDDRIYGQSRKEIEDFKKQLAQE